MNRRRKPDEVCDDTGEQRADGIAEVTPESVHAEAGRAPRRVHMVGDGRQQCGIDHRRAESLQRGSSQPRDIGRNEDRQPDPSGLDDHASSDQLLPAEAVRQRSGRDLQNAHTMG